MDLGFPAEEPLTQIICQDEVKESGIAQFKREAK